METQGYIVDKKTLAPVKAYWELYNKRTGEIFATATADVYNIWVTDDPDNTYLKITASGYKTFDSVVTALTEPSDDIYLQKKSLPYIEIIAAIALFTYAAKHKKKVGELTPNDLKMVALGLGGIIAFEALQKILEGLGLWRSIDTKAIDNYASNPNSFWSPNYYLTLLSQGVTWSTGITRTTADIWLKDLDNAFSFFGDNEAVAKGILERCQTQATLSFLAWCYNQNTGGNFLSFLRGQDKWYPWGGLSDADINEVSQYISKLPKY